MEVDSESTVPGLSRVGPSASALETALRRSLDCAYKDDMAKLRSDMAASTAANNEKVEHLLAAALKSQQDLQQWILRKALQDFKKEMASLQKARRKQNVAALPLPAAQQQQQLLQQQAEEAARMEAAAAAMMGAAPPPYDPLHDALNSRVF